MRAWHVVVALAVVGLGVAAASAISQPRRDFAVQIVSDGSMYGWRLIDNSDAGRVIAQSGMEYPSESSARAAAASAMEVGP
jgi:hypothetical protein